MEIILSWLLLLRRLMKFSVIFWCVVGSKWN